MESAGVFGPKLSGKTTLARELSRQYWVRTGRRSLVLDPNLEDWGKHSWVTDDEGRFWVAVWKSPVLGKSKPSLVIVEEAAETINRDKGLTSVFTRLRHLNHKLIVIGHSGENLLPIMRQQLDTLYLFRQSPDDAERWARSMTQEGFLTAAELNQYEFLYGERFKPPVKRKLDLKTLGKNSVIRA
jgi:hypothetical protein